MKKYRHTAFPLLLTVLNAAEQEPPHAPTDVYQTSVVECVPPAAIELTIDDVVSRLSQGMSKSYKVGIRCVLARKVNPDLYKDFINTVNVLSEGMDANHKWQVIEALGEVNPDWYTKPFINTVNALSQGMKVFNKWQVIEALGCVNPDLYKDFINIVNALSQGMNANHKLYVIEALGCVNPDLYTEPFINTVNELSEGMDGHNKGYVIAALGKVHPDLYKDFINIVNALSQGMNIDKWRVIYALGCVNPDRYTEPFINTVNALSQEMDGHNKGYIIDALGKVNPDLYTELFINTINALSQGMDGHNKGYVIAALGCVNPDRYTEPFIKNVNALSQRMNIDKWHVIGALGKVHPDLYKDFINTINELSQGVDEQHDKEYVIYAVKKVNPDHYPFLQNFIRQNPQYFTYVPASQFLKSITPNMTQQQLQAGLERLHREYYNDAPAGTPQALAFEIHNFANQNVVGETGQKQSFNGAVLEHIQRSIQGPILTYDVVLDLLRAELATLQSDPLKSDAIDEAVYNWVIESNKEPQDKNAIDLVVTYLEQKDNTHGKLRTWLYAFMDESKKAYDGKNSESCKKGVKERVITSLRSAIPEGDAALENFFHQAEAPFMMAAKSKKLTDYAFWAEKLKQKGVTSATHKDIAKDKFKEALVDFFGTDKGAQATIDATLETFDDSDSDSDDASLRLAAPGDGLWSKIKAAL